VVGQQNADTANTLQLRDIAMATILWLSTYGVHIDATWQIWLNHPCVAAMRPYFGHLFWVCFGLLSLYVLKLLSYS